MINLPFIPLPPGGMPLRFVCPTCLDFIIWPLLSLEAPTSLAIANLHTLMDFLHRKTVKYASFPFGPESCIMMAVTTQPQLLEGTRPC